MLSFYLLSQTSSFKQFIQNKERKEAKTARMTCGNHFATIDIIRNIGSRTWYRGGGAEILHRWCELYLPSLGKHSIYASFPVLTAGGELASCGLQKEWPGMNVTYDKLICIFIFFSIGCVTYSLGSCIHSFGNHSSILFNAIISWHSLIRASRLLPELLLTAHHLQRNACIIKLFRDDADMLPKSRQAWK